MQREEKHYHAWILQNINNKLVYQAMEGLYQSHLTCRRHAIKSAGGDTSKVVIMVCRGAENCPSKYEAVALAT